MQNEVQVFSNEELGLQARTIKNPDGSISVNAEDTAIGFGWVQQKNGKVYVKWERVNGFCKELGFSPQVGKDDFIPEPLFYRLGMKASNPTADKFQNWLAFDVIPSIRKTGSYEMPKPQKEKNEHLASVNNAVKILTPLLQAAGCNSQIQLLTAKTLYEKAGVELPLMIEADQQYYDTVHIARHVGIYYQSSGKPADKAVNEIIRRLNISENLYTETWESKGKWQGTVRKYAPQVIEMVKQWYSDNGYPRDIDYVQCDGQVKTYHVIFRDAEVA